MHEPNSIITLNQPESRTSVPNQPAWQLGTVPRRGSRVVNRHISRRSMYRSTRNSSALPARARTLTMFRTRDAYAGPRPCIPARRAASKTPNPNETSSSLRRSGCSPFHPPKNLPLPAASQHRDRQAWRTCAWPAKRAEPGEACRAGRAVPCVPGRRSAAPSAFERVRIWAASRGHVLRCVARSSRRGSVCRRATATPTRQLPLPNPPAGRTFSTCLESSRHRSGGRMSRRWILFRQNFSPLVRIRVKRTNKKTLKKTY